MADVISVIGLAAFASAITVAFILIRITSFEDRIPSLVKDVQGLLAIIETELKEEVDKICKTKEKSEETGYDGVVSIASEFSVVSSLRTNLASMRKQNTANAKLDLGSIVFTALAIVANLAPPQDLTGTGIILADGFAVVFWGISLYTFWKYYSEMSELRENILERSEKHSKHRVTSHSSSEPS